VVGGLVVALVVRLVIGEQGGILNEVLNGRGFGEVLTLVSLLAGGGLVGGLVLGLNGGGGAFIRHFILRAQLAFEGSAPFRYVPFLEYATTLIFLQRNGGAYRFRHDLLQEYFAALT
jgi:hypothetical protein